MIEKKYRGPGKRKHQNRGRCYNRTKYIPAKGHHPGSEWVNKEKVFADHWEEENRRLPYVNYGQGILQDLFMKPGSLRHYPYATHVINCRERMIVATVIQWLGSNCGFGWLIDVLKECGWELRRIEKKK